MLCVSHTRQVHICRRITVDRRQSRRVLPPPTHAPTPSSQAPRVGRQCLGGSSGVLSVLLFAQRAWHGVGHVTGTQLPGTEPAGRPELTWLSLRQAPQMPTL